jgi:hypothetical protein
MFMPSMPLEAHAEISACSDNHVSTIRDLRVKNTVCRFAIFVSAIRGALLNLVQIYGATIRNLSERVATLQR